MVALLLEAVTRAFSERSSDAAGWFCRRESKKGAVDRRLLLAFVSA
jgi:hypothetical protein